MDTKEHAHAHLAGRLHLPDYYGNNLDALSDCLGEIGTPTRIYLVHSAAMTASLGDYGERLLNVLNDAARKNGSLVFVRREHF